MTTSHTTERDSTPGTVRPRELDAAPTSTDTSGNDQVVLLDAARRAIGTAARRSVHTDQTPLHRAFSVHLFDAEGRVLITRRALSKATWPGVWTNSCCGHPRPGEDDTAAILRRSGEELGLAVRDVQVVLPDFSYTARDASGVVENEFCPVHVARVLDPEALSVDPDEVVEWAWVDPKDLRETVRRMPTVFSPWAVRQISEGALDEPPEPTGEDPVHRRADDGHPGAETTLRAVDAVIAHRLEQTIATWQELTADAGPDVLPHDLPQWLAGLVSGGGKRLRTTACHWGFIAAGGQLDTAEHQTAVTAAAAVELLHQFALIHDDVMDQSDLRRGVPSAHRQAERWHREGSESLGDPALFGQNLAILLGDLALTEANRVAASLPTPIAGDWHRLCIELVLGQRADLTGAAVGRRDLDHAHRTARWKSGSYTVAWPLVLGADSAGATPEAHRALRRYGDLVGAAFALRDDLLGVFGETERTGKPNRDDLASGKATVLLALARERFTGVPGEALRRLGTARMCADDPAVVQREMERAGIQHQVEAMVADLVGRARAMLDDAGLDPVGVAGLTDFADSIAWRLR